MRRILVVDDDTLILRSYRRLFAELLDRAEIVIATTPEEARAILSSTPLTLVLCDLELAADATGVDVLLDAASRQPNARRILLSGGDAARLRSLVDGATVHASLEKGVDPATFVRAIEDELARGPQDADRVASLLCIGCRQTYYAEGHSVLACPRCGGTSIRGADVVASAGALNVPGETTGAG